MLCIGKTPVIHCTVSCSKKHSKLHSTTAQENIRFPDALVAESVTLLGAERPQGKPPPPGSAVTLKWFG